MVGGLESARSIVHLGELFRLADRAGVLLRPSGGRAHAPAAGAGRCGRVSQAAPLADLSRVSLNQITADQLALEEAIDGCAGAGIALDRRLAPQARRRRRAGGR